MYGDCPGGHPVAIASATGAGLIAVNSSYCTSSSPRWSPLDDRILFTMGANIYTVKTDLTDMRLVASAINPAGSAWAPSGTQIYLSMKPGANTHHGIYRMNLDGSNLVPVLVDSGHDAFVMDVSPLGDWIMFYRNGEVWAMTATGTHVTQIVANGAPQEGARWVR